MIVYYIYERNFKENNYNKFHAFIGKNTGDKNTSGGYVRNIKSIFTLWNGEDSRFIADGQDTHYDGVDNSWEEVQKRIVKFIFDGTFQINSTTEIRVTI